MEIVDNFRGHKQNRKHDSNNSREASEKKRHRKACALAYLLSSVGILWVSNRSEQRREKRRKEVKGIRRRRRMRGAVEGRLLAMAMRSSTRQHRHAVSAVRAASSPLVTDFLHILVYSMVAFCTIEFGSLFLSVCPLSCLPITLSMYSMVSLFFWFCLFFWEERERETRMELCVWVMSTLSSWRWWLHFNGFCFLTAITLTSEALLWLWTLWIESSVVVVWEGNPNLVQLDQNLVTYLTVLWHLAFDSEVQVSNSFFDYRSDGKLLDVNLWIGGTCLWDSHFLLICSRRAAVQIDGRSYILYEFQRNATFCCINVNRAGIKRGKFILLYRIELM